MLIGGIALIAGALRFHGQYYPVAIIATGGLIYWHKNILGEQFEPFTIATGAMLIVMAHVINMRLIRRTRYQRKLAYAPSLSGAAK